MDWLDKFRPQVIDLKLYFYADSESLNSGHWKCYKTLSNPVKHIHLVGYSCRTLVSHNLYLINTNADYKRYASNYSYL